ncbi:hypothetical protein [Streptomyces sp. NPDC088348]|uniref:hypothetical protein n=1 Tax=Streptomyces sp. NPDC088348 TaxID=3365853 RepID=UPI00382BE29E
MSGDNDLIVPSGIPQFTGHLDQLDSDALALSAEAVLFRTSGASVHSTFQGLSAFYKAPEAEQLFATTGPVATKSDSIADDLERAASALSAYSAEVRPVVARLKSLKADAIAFVDSVQGDEHWRRDQDKVDHNNDLWHDVNAAEDAFTSAERACYSKITALVGGAPLIADDGTHKPNMYGYKADVLDHAEQTPWGAPAEREYTGLAWLGHQAKSYVWDGFVVDGVWGTVKGLGTLVGTDGWDKAGQAWEGLAKLATGLALSSPGIAPFYWSTPDKKLPSWLRDSRKAVKDTGKALVAWDEWGKNPARAAGAVTFNIVTTVFTEGAGTAAKTGALAKTVSVVGKAGRLVDPMTYVGKAGKFATIKVGDLFAGLRNIHSGAYNDILSGTGHLQPDGTVLKTGADTPVVTGTHIEWPDGTRLDLDDGTVVRPDGTTAPAHVELSAADRTALEGSLPRREPVPAATHTVGHADAPSPSSIADHAADPPHGGLDHGHGPGPNHEPPSGPRKALPPHGADSHAGAHTNESGSGGGDAGGPAASGGSHEPSEPLGNLPDGSWKGPQGLHLDPKANAAADQFMRRSELVEPRITHAVRSAAERVEHGKLQGLDYRLKGEDSLKRKLATDILEDGDRAPEWFLSGIKDSVRYTLEVPSHTYTHGVEQAVADLQARGFENVSFKNTWESPGYKGINSTWLDPISGQVFELQFHTPESFSAKMDGHALYEKERLPGVSSEDLAAIKAEQQELFGKVPHPSGAETIHFGHGPDDPGRGLEADHPTNDAETGRPPGATGGGWGGAGWVTTPSEHAGQIYEGIRATPNKIDLPVISAHTGVNESVLRQVKSHLFRSQHEVAVGPGTARRGLFEPRDDVAELWQDARAGSLAPDRLREFKSLLAHEYIESQLMKSGLPYIHDHPSLYALEDDGTYIKQFPRKLEHAGAHDLAPHPVEGHFNHWKRALGLEPPAVVLSEDLSNIDDVVKAAVQELRSKGLNLK